MNKFKIGDRVMIKNVTSEDIENGVKVGMTATVLENSIAPYLKIDNWVTNNDNYGFDIITGVEFETVCYAMDETQLEKTTI